MSVYKNRLIDKDWIEHNTIQINVFDRNRIKLSNRISNDELDLVSVDPEALRKTIISLAKVLTKGSEISYLEAVDKLKYSKLTPRQKVILINKFYPDLV